MCSFYRHFWRPLPAAEQIKDNVIQKTFSFEAASYDISHYKILAIVSWIYGGYKGVIHAQGVKAGLNKAFD